MIAYSRSLGQVRRRVEYAIVASAFSVGFGNLSCLFKAGHDFVHQWRMLDGRNRSTADVRGLLTARELALGAHVRSRPGITLAQAQAWLLTEHGVEFSTGAIWNAARHIGLSFKKALRSAEQDRPDVAARRKLWRAAQPLLDPESLVFLDETGLNTKMARLYGWAPVAQRGRDKAPFGHWKTMTFIAGLRLSGMTAPWLLDRAMDGDAFRMYVQHVLAPTLKRGDVVVLDNLPAHKVAGSARRLPIAAPRSSTCRLIVQT